jgi:DNA-binding NtrC family response regulator
VSQINGTTHTVLLVDDDADVLRWLTRVLQKQPYQLFTARCGEEAVGILQRTSVDVVVTDQRMPGMSGTDLLAWIERNCPKVVRILLTGCASADNLLRAINEGGVYYCFTKPCNEASLAIMIRKAIEHKDLLGRCDLLTEANRQQAEDCGRLAEKLQLLRQIAARDLDRPLGQVSERCRQVLERYPDAVDAKARSLLEESLEAVSQMQGILREILANVQPPREPGKEE